MSRFAKVYLEDRECCKCGNNKTYEVGFNRVLWYRDIDDKGKWTGKWVCSRCYSKMRRRKKEEERKRIMKIKRILIENGMA